jgi:AcrR family transcriptional regulator
MPAAPRPHHRLDERLVDVAVQLAACEGVESLTLRRIARRAGVSHGAPLRHFAGLADLLAEVAALAVGLRAYVACAVENPGLFALMFRPEALDARNPSFRRDSEAAFQQLLRQVRAAQEAGWHRGRDARLLAGAVWASVHGLATLWSQGALAHPVVPASLDDAIATTLELILGEIGERPPRS